MSERTQEQVATVAETERVWVAWSNTDLTEGRGWPIALCVAESPETALRRGRKGGVMGSDCHVTEEIAVKVGHQWLVPGRIERETMEDTAARMKRQAREAAAAKARAAGLSDDEITALIGGT